MNRITIIAFLCLFVQTNILAQEGSTDRQQQAVCPIVKVIPEKLPSLNIPRSGHHTICANGEITVFGGHTAGFVPTPTAEYFKNGAWHQMNMVYTHDAGSALVMKSGKVLLSGGFERALGIGQSYEVELYDPQTHTFEGFGCLDTKRASHAQLELDSGRVLITGNWYHGDSIEIYDGDIHFNFIKEASQHRTFPNIFRIAPDDAIIFSGEDTRGHDFDTIIVDRLKGDSFSDPFFDTWKPQHLHIPIHSDDCFIGDEAKGRYTYLFPVKNKMGQLAIAKADGMQFSLLPTTSVIPMKHEDKPIHYYSQIIVDRKALKGYIMGNDSTHQTNSRLYILCVDYSPAMEGKPCPITLYYTVSGSEMTGASPLITPEGNLLLTGGVGKKEYPSQNFYPSSDVLLFHFGSEPAASFHSILLWLIGALLLMAILVYSFIRYRQQKRKLEMPEKEIEIEVDEPQTSDSKTATNDELMQRIHHIVVEEQKFLDSELTASSLATQLSTHRNNISSCINNQMGYNFSQYINTYRVEHAKKLMLQDPDMKLSTVALESGFANEMSFYRNFKAIIGTTPSEWRNKID